MDRLIDALKHARGAYRSLVLTEEGLIACRDPAWDPAARHGQAREATIFAPRPSRST
jgi:amidophosphoribosyltransferase